MEVLLAVLKTMIQRNTCPQMDNFLNKKKKTDRRYCIFYLLKKQSHEHNRKSKKKKEKKRKRHRKIHKIASFNKNIFSCEFQRLAEI